MSHEIAWHVELAVRPGQLESFRELTFEMVEFVASEPGVLAYERFVSADGATVHVYERYKSSAAAVAHLRNFASKFAERFSAMVDRRRFAVFGVAEPELRTILDPLGAVYLTPFGRDRA
ncbi:MAG: antibiotic biosynthesis monooxygenase [Alphaproteobacteria bacterium]|nr:antibiotic biosynthesis monooxygenase [Alphaproteobacteria bacterium]MBV9150313.1 antibiotic biosynthesis monooxygenase [Alphaproteobacteria bacterium]MBV9587059.1 antibiotic biosynthesis monooxygenase [Alphaproteobacteria bacterium]MBV9965876.1 antibiotic biosynthesis monooxygenase [Alphaproteobacteria bacterium]